MAYIDSSEIVLDAVLTDEGKRQLARGELNIEYFALFDDEVDYTLYDESAVSGDTDKAITSLPLLEAIPSLRPKYFLCNREPRTPRRVSVPVTPQGPQFTEISTA